MAYLSLHRALRVLPGDRREGKARVRPKQKRRDSRHGGRGATVHLDHRQGPPETSLAAGRPWRRCTTCRLRHAALANPSVSEQQAGGRTPCCPPGVGVPSPLPSSGRVPPCSPPCALRSTRSRRPRCPGGSACCTCGSRRPRRPPALPAPPPQGLPRTTASSGASASAKGGLRGHTRPRQQGGGGGRCGNSSTRASRALGDLG